MNKLSRLSLTLPAHATIPRRSNSIFSAIPSPSLLINGVSPEKISQNTLLNFSCVIKPQQLSQIWIVSIATTLNCFRKRTATIPLQSTNDETHKLRRISKPYHHHPPLTPSLNGATSRQLLSPVFIRFSSSFARPPRTRAPERAWTDQHPRHPWIVVAARDWLKSRQTGRKMILAIFCPITRELELHSYYGFLF